MSTSLGQLDGFPPAQRPSTGYKREDALWKYRTDMERVHRVLIQLHAITLSYTVSLKVVDLFPEMMLRDILDTCNKSLALYIPLRRHCRALHYLVANYMYHWWFCLY